jgi:TRAP-type mannitol/chloroaromatic compound transport system substrate-binding protein
MKTLGKMIGCLLISVVIAVLAGTPANAADKVFQWRMQVLWDPGTMPFELEKKFVERVEQLSNGRLVIKLFPPGSLVPTTEMLDALQAGMIDMMKQYEGYYIGKMPEVAFTSSLPLGFTDAWQFETWFWQLGGVEMLRESYRKLGVFYIAPTIYGEEPIHSKVPIRSVNDLKGKKGRFVGLAGPVMQKLGASVTPLPTAEVYSALEKGVIDFADRGDLAANYDAGLYQVAKYIILPGFHQPTTAAIYAANLGKWNQLPKDLQEIVIIAAREASAEHFQFSLVKGMEALEKFKEKGVEVIYLPENEIKQIRIKAMEVWEEYANKSPQARKVLDSQKRWMKMIDLLD